MLSQKLHDVVTQAEHLSPEEQDALAEAISVLLDEQNWNRSFADPRSQTVLQRMADAALQAHQAGQTDECD